MAMVYSSFDGYFFHGTPINKAQTKLLNNEYTVLTATRFYWQNICIKDV